MRSRTDPRRHTLRAWALWWVVCAAEYLALVDRTAVQELAFGAVLAAVAATAAVLVRRRRESLLSPKAPSLRPVAGLVTDLPRLVRALRRRRGAGLVEVPYAGEGTERVLTETFGSLAPNTIVVEVDAERGVLVAHQLVRDEARVVP